VKLIRTITNVTVTNILNIHRNGFYAFFDYSNDQQLPDKYNPLDLPIDCCSKDTKVGDTGVLKYYASPSKGMWIFEKDL